MTVESTLNKKIYMGNGITRHFPIPFFVAEASHIFLIVKDANGSRPIVNNFGVNLENKTVEYPLSGEILSISEELTIYRKVPLTQVVDLENAGAFHPKVLEHDGFDRIVMQVQQIAEESSRSIKVDINAEESPSDLLLSIFDAKEVAIQKAADADMSAQASATSAMESLVSEGKADESAKNSEKSSNNSKIWANIAETKADLSFNSALASQASAGASALSATASTKSACESMEYANSSMESALESKEGARVSIEKSCESLESADASDLSSQSAQASATVAAASAANSATSASESLTSANAAIESAISAKFWAVAELFENTEGSSKYWALQAGSGIVDATEILKGKIQLATNKEVLSGIVPDKAVTPKSFSYGVDNHNEREDAHAPLMSVHNEREDAHAPLMSSHNADTQAHRNQFSRLDSFATRLIGDIDFFNRQTPPEGYAVGNGALLANIDIAYPFLLSELQKPENAWRLKTEVEYQALIHEDGVGGANAFVLDVEANTIRLPDIRGDYMAGAGWNAKVVGESDGDAIRNIIGVYDVGGGYSIGWAGRGDSTNGAFVGLNSGSWGSNANGTSSVNGFGGLSLDASRVVPTDTRNHPATIYMLACVYIGKATTPTANV